MRTLSPHFSLRSLLIFMAIFAFYFPCERAFHKWYYPKFSKYQMLSFIDKLHDGMPIAEMDDKANVLNRLRSENLDKVVKEDRNRVQLNDGIYYVKKSWFSTQIASLKEGEELYHCRFLTGVGLVLRFKDGKLIGHKPRPLTAKVLRNEFLSSEIPSPLFRYGLFPLYFIPVILVWLFIASRPLYQLRRFKNLKLYRSQPSFKRPIDLTLRYKVTSYLLQLFRT